MDGSAPNSPAQRRPRTWRLLVGLGAVVLVLSVVFGWVTLRHRAAYRDYHAATVEQGPLPWEQRPMTVDECVETTVAWAMDCPGLESWCANEAPQLTRQCLESDDRTDYCRSVGDAVASTQFGYHECERLRADVEGRHTKRSHKKFCAASYRAVAEHCRRIAQ